MNIAIRLFLGLLAFLACVAVYFLMGFGLQYLGLRGACIVFPQLPLVIYLLICTAPCIRKFCDSKLGKI